MINDYRVKVLISAKIAFLEISNTDILIKNLFYIHILLS